MYKKLVQVEINEDLNLAAFCYDMSEVEGFFDLRYEIRSLQTLEKLDKPFNEVAQMLSVGWNKIEFEVEEHKSKDGELIFNMVRLLDVESECLRVISLRWEIRNQMGEIISFDNEVILPRIFWKYGF